MASFPSGGLGLGWGTEDLCVVFGVDWHPLQLHGLRFLRLLLRINLIRNKDLQRIHILVILRVPQISQKVDVIPEIVLVAVMMPEVEPVFLEPPSLNIANQASLFEKIV